MTGRQVQYQVALGGFHKHRGKNVEFTDVQRRTARRKHSVEWALVFSSRPLLVNEAFNFVIDEQGSCWTGHLRMGLTMHSPNSGVLRELPPCAMPHLGCVCITTF